MDYTLIEINKHKNNISNLSTKLINTSDINEEISINNEIKKETEILVSLFNIKMNNNQFQQQMMQFQMQQHMQAAQQAQNMQNQMQNILSQNQFQPPKPIDIIFRVSGATGQESAPIMVQCMSDEKVSDVIEKYRNQSNDRDMTKKFIFNAMPLNPNLTVAEAGMEEGSNVFVVVVHGVKGG